MKANLKTVALAVMAGLSFAAFAAEKPDGPMQEKPPAAAAAPADSAQMQKKRPVRRCRTKKAPKKESVKKEPVTVTGMIDSAE